MEKNSFINWISFGFSFFQIIIFILDCITANENTSYCSSKADLKKTFILEEIQYFRYINFASYSNGNMVFLTTPYYERYRMFYGFKENGRPLFNDSYFFSTQINENGSEYKWESESLVIRESINISENKEYLMSISKGLALLEIYDFDNNNIYTKNLKEFTNNTINSFRHALISLKPNDNNYYFLLGFINDYYEYIIQKHLFYSIKNFTSGDNTLIESIKVDYIEAINRDSGLSCFQTEKQFIICFFLNNEGYSIITFDTNLIEVNRTMLNSQIIGNNPFYKCLHLKDEIGIFTYYNNSFPVLLFKEFNNITGFKNYSFSEIILNQEIYFSNDLLLNDIIKLTKNKIYYCTTNTRKIDKYIISIYLYNETYKIRYYIIKLPNYRIHNEMRIHIYKNFLAFAFSYEIYNYFYEYYNAFLILNYPNSTDYNLSLIQNLFQNSNHSDIYINLENETQIENNLFGYVFSGIIISHLENCDDNLKLISSISNKTINPNYTLIKNEKIKLDFNKNYTKFNCSMQYSYKATEPDLDCYDSYIDYYGGFNETPEDFNTTKDEYIGRLSYYNIILNENLTTDCADTNCEFCSTNKKSKSSCIICKYNNTFSEDYQTKNCLDQVIWIGDNEIIIRELKESKEEFVINSVEKVINSIDINKNYVMKGKDYTVMIRPTNSSPILSLTHVDFEPCEKILRDHYKIPDSRIITFLQLEIDNLDSQSVVNQVGYQAFDDEKKPLNLSLCNNTNIQIFYLLKSNSSLDILFISSFKDSNIDLFNLDNEFFTDICFSYSYSENDVVLEDRIKDFYQNYSLCDDGCTYNDINIEYMTITCDCEVKTNLTTTQKVINLKQIKDVDKSSIFEIIRCYNLVFSFKNKLNNIGFWIFLILTIGHIPLLIIYFYNGLKPIKEYLIKEMVKYGYISKKDTKELFSKDNNKNEKSNKNAEEKSESKLKKKKSKKKLDKLHSPPKKNSGNKNKMISLISNKIDLIDSSSTNKIKEQNNKIFDELNNIVSENENPSSKVRKKRIKKHENNTSEKVKTKKILIKKPNKKKNRNSSIAPTQGDFPDEKQIKHNNNIINLSLINININNPTSYKITGSNHVLNIYTFEEAIKYDMRSLFRIYYIYLLAKQSIFHAFLFKSPLELFPLRFCLLIFIISSDLALNALFYFDDKISEKYRYTKGLLLFAFSNNITVILLSTAIGFILLTLFTKLSNSTNEIRRVFKEEEKKLKKDKKYKVTEDRKKEILKEIELILKRYKIKVIVFIVIELILILFFWYYVTAFCHVYSSTQKSWLWDSFLSMLSRLIIDLLFCLGFAKLYRIGVESNINCIYKISIFFYSFN